MLVQYASFSIPASANSPDQEELNRFLRGHRVVQIQKELVNPEGGPRWLLLVEYMEDGGAQEHGQGLGKVDYKEVLSAEDFAVFSKLRDIRKTVAEAQGIPVYAVFTNEQLADMARKRPRTQTELKKLEGIGEGKSSKFGEPFVQAIAGAGGEAGGMAF